jgi:hypothetical protein
MYLPVQHGTGTLRNRIRVCHEHDDLRLTFRARLLRWGLLRRGFFRRRLSGRRFLWRWFALHDDGHRFPYRASWRTHHKLEGCGLLQAYLFLTLWTNLPTIQEHREVLGAAHLPMQHGATPRRHHFVAGPELYFWLSARAGEYATAHCAEEDHDHQQSQSSM